MLTPVLPPPLSLLPMTYSPAANVSDPVHNDCFTCLQTVPARNLVRFSNLSSASPALTRNIIYLKVFFAGVQLWMQIFQHIITAMLFFQIIMIALFGIKKAAGPAVLTAPLPFLTIAFLLYNLNLFNRPQVIISNRTAADIDKRQSQVRLPVCYMLGSPVMPFNIHNNETVVCL